MSFSASFCRKDDPPLGCTDVQDPASQALASLFLRVMHEKRRLEGTRRTGCEALVAPQVLFIEGLQADNVGTSLRIFPIRSKRSV